MVKEGKLDELIAIEDQTEIVVKDATPELLAEITALIEKSAGSTLLRTGKPRTTLERLFLRETTNREEQP
jgi:ABC-2 type transport system ATP-binding protein